MIRSIGLDLVEIERLRRDTEQFGERFVNRLLGPAERELYTNRSDKAEFLAGRFAAKEAVVKALAPFLSERPAWAQMQILPGSGGEPVLCLDESLKPALSGVRCLLSITHERQHAAAVAIFEDQE